MCTCIMNTHIVRLSLAGWPRPHRDADRPLRDEALQDTCQSLHRVLRAYIYIYR